MKWNKAIKEIENRLAKGEEVTIAYHRKYITAMGYIDKVWDVNPYEWKGTTCKSVNTSRDLLDEGSHIIDAIY